MKQDGISTKEIYEYQDVYEGLKVYKMKWGEFLKYYEGKGNKLHVDNIMKTRVDWVAKKAGPHFTPSSFKLVEVVAVAKKAKD